MLEKVRGGTKFDWVIFTKDRFFISFARNP